MLEVTLAPRHLALEPGLDPEDSYPFYRISLSIFARRASTTAHTFAPNGIFLGMAALHALCFDWLRCALNTRRSAPGFS